MSFITIRRRQQGLCLTEILSQSFKPFACKKLKQNLEVLSRIGVDFQKWLKPLLVRSYFDVNYHQNCFIASNNFNDQAT